MREARYFEIESNRLGLRKPLGLGAAFLKKLLFNYFIDYSLCIN